MLSIKKNKMITVNAASEPENPWASPPAPRAPRSSNDTGKQTYSQQRRGGGGGGSSQPPLPPFLNEFRRFFGRDASPFKTFFIILGIVVFLWLAGGLYRVQPEENVALLRFGKYTHTVTDAGLHYHLPWPFESIIKENVTFERRIEIGFRGISYGGSMTEDKPEESMMLTGDANIVDLDFVVQWKIADAKQFLFNIREPEATLKRVAESAMREVIGQNNLQDIITDRREDIAIRVKSIMQEIVNSYGAGVMVTQVLIQDANAPPSVVDAFEDVNKARQEAETMRNQALRYRNEIIPRAQGESIRLVKEGEGYKEQVASQAKGEAQRFIDIYQAYSQAKEVTRDRLYIEAWEQVLRNNDVVILDSNAKSGAMPFMNVNDFRKKKDDSANSQETIR